METLKKPMTFRSEYSLLKVTFILFSAFFTSTILLFYSYSLKEFIPTSNMTREYIICFGPLIFQGTLFLAFAHQKQMLLKYLYNMSMVSFIGALLLTPVLFSSIVFYPFSLGAYYFLAYFMIVVLLMFLLHRKRVKKMEAPAWLTYTWVLYRLIVLIIVLQCIL